MKESHQRARFQRRRTVRLSKFDEQEIALQADIAGLPVAEYMRRKLLGNGPIMARVDLMMVNELRRVGGLLKHNFTTLRQVGAGKGIIMEQEATLGELQKLIETIGESYDHQKAAEKRNDEIKGAAD